MRKLAVSLSKGGVGKSTTTISLAHGLALQGLRVLIVDTDTQGQVSRLLGIKPEAGLAELMAKSVPPEDAVTEAREGLWILAGGRHLAGIRREISRMDEGAEKVLTEAMAPYRGKYDFIILDTPPAWDDMTANVLFYADEILTPVSLEAATIFGLMEFEEHLGLIQKHHRKLALKYVVPTFLDGRVKKSEEILAQLQARYSKLVCQPIRYSVRLSECAGLGQSIFEYAPKSQGAEDYTKLVERVMADGR